MDVLVFQFVSKKCYLRKYTVVGCKYMETFGCMSMPFGCMSMDRLGACMRLLGAKYAETFGCMYAEVGCKFHNG